VITTPAGINDILEEHSRMKRRVELIQASDDGPSEPCAEIRRPESSAP
jgi:hypothetical protein